MNDVTNDVTKFGYREIAIAGELLTAYVNRPCEFMGNGVQVWFNPSSGYVFLSDEDYNVGVLEGDMVVQFFSCPVCGYGATQADALEDGKDFEEHEGYCCKSCEDENEGR